LPPSVTPGNTELKQNEELSNSSEANENENRPMSVIGTVHAVGTAALDSVLPQGTTKYNYYFPFRISF